MGRIFDFFFYRCFYNLDFDGLLHIRVKCGFAGGGYGIVTIKNK